MNTPADKTKYFVRHDTAAWKGQVWAAFAAAVLLCTVAVWNMPSTSLDRVLAAVSMFFLLSATFTLSKMLRDNQYEKVDTSAWVLQVWAAFGIAVALTSWGIFRMTIVDWHKWFVLGSTLFLLSSAFTLAKTLRDNQEADAVEDKMKPVDTEAE